MTESYVKTMIYHDGERFKVVITPSVDDTYGRAEKPPRVEEMDGQATEETGSGDGQWPGRVEMDLCALRESLHRLALLEEAANVGSSGNARQEQQQQESPQPTASVHELKCDNGSGYMAKRDAEDAQKNFPRSGKPSRGERAKGESTRSPTRRNRGGGGGIRVYEEEEHDWILSTAAAWENSGRSDYKKCPLMRLRVLINGVAALLCVSMGSNVNVLKPEIAKRARLSAVKVEPPVWVSFDAGRGHGPGVPIDYQVVSAPYQIDDFFAQDDFFLTPELKGRYVDGIVGIDWLEKYKPTVNYRLHRIELIDLSGRVHVIESAPGSERAGRGENECHWISARTWDWDMENFLHYQHLMET